MNKALIYLLLFFILTLPIPGQGLKLKAEEQIMNFFDDYVVFSFEKVKIEDNHKNEIEKKFNQKFFRDEIYHWEIFSSDTLIAHAFLDNVIGRTQPITFLVIINKNSEILNVSIVKYRSHRGSGVTNRNWLDQFNNKNINSGFKPGDDIQGISGATYSVRSLSKGINKLLFFFNKKY